MAEREPGGFLPRQQLHGGTDPATSLGQVGVEEPRAERASSPLGCELPPAVLGSILTSAMEPPGRAVMGLERFQGAGLSSGGRLIARGDEEVSESKMKAQTPGRPGLGFWWPSVEGDSTSDRGQPGDGQPKAPSRTKGWRSMVHARGLPQHHPPRGGLEPCPGAHRAHLPPDTTSPHDVPKPPGLPAPFHRPDPENRALRGWTQHRGQDEGRKTQRPGTNEPSDHWKTKSL